MESAEVLIYQIIGGAFGLAILLGALKFHCWLEKKKDEMDE